MIIIERRVFGFLEKLIEYIPTSYDWSNIDLYELYKDLDDIELDKYIQLIEVFAIKYEKSNVFGSKHY